MAWYLVFFFFISYIFLFGSNFHYFLFFPFSFYQAFIFWVVDNFLKRQIRQTKSLSITSDDVSVKYFRHNDRLKYYNHIEKSQDFEADMLLMDDDEINTSSPTAMLTPNSGSSRRLSNSSINHRESREWLLDSPG